MIKVNKTRYASLDKILKIKVVFRIDSLLFNQNQSLDCIMESKDVFLSTKTSSGKSI